MEDGHAQTRIFLPRDPRSVSRARRFVAEYCRAQGLTGEDCDTVILLVSELVTNALLHGEGAVTVALQHTAGTIRGAVRDADPDPLPAPPAAAAGAESGRGLAIVAALAHRWSVDRDRDGDGKSVWFELGVRSGEGSLPRPRRAADAGQGT